MEFSFTCLILLFQLLCFTAAQRHRGFPITRCQKTTTNTVYLTNVQTALASVSSAVAIHHGFNKTSVGENPNNVTAAALCRGDIGLETCKDCISSSVVLLHQNCSNQTEALIWTWNCSLLYSNRTYTSTFYNRPYAKVLSYVNASNVDAFGTALRNLAGSLRTEAAGGSSLRKFATGDAVFGPDSTKVYALMQCAPDLSSFDCNSCLSVVFREAQGCCDGDIDVAVYYTSCFVRYVSFYNDPPAISLPAISPSSTLSPATQDVFAFGVVILEIITGQKSSSFFDQDDHEDLLHFAWKNWKDGTKMELVDPAMVETCCEDEVMRCINIGLLSGENSEEQVSAIFYCPPNIHADLCKCCVRNAITYLLKKCPKQNKGVAWDNYPFLSCMVRYSTGRKILSMLDDWAWYHLKEDSNHVKAVNLQKTMDSLLSKLKEEAARGDALRKYARGNVIYDGDELALYVAVQCTPNL
ncbi:hypothetical protein L1987_28402 [Smallanthus sonchifolius]|uniref:Uncharacterized protein n=1 Tax=Smallanthus sonchifolius TaxID=185202 RepID=A0ACB9HYW9_9ASTR|nr:hypothetical protein L1987_28402 [Smallanthus sonchifolius]